MPDIYFKADFNEESQDFNADMGEVQMVKYVTDDHTELMNRDAPDQHPISAITGLEEALAGVGQDKTFVFLQPSASQVWEIEHDLDKMPSVSIVDSAGTMVVGDVDYISSSKIVITFQGAFSGRAFLN